MQKAYKTTMDSGFLVPVFCEEVLPGDSFRAKMTAFARLSTPIVPVMDNMKMTSFFFFVANRLVWTNWEKFMGEQDNPADSINFVIPKTTSPVNGYPVNSIFDYFGLPTVGQVTSGSSVTHSALPLRAYNLIYNEWFRDENLQNSLIVNKGDGPDANGDYVLRRRGKRHDYFTACLPWPQKGGIAVTLPLGVSAPVRTATTDTVTGAQQAMRMRINNGSLIAGDTVTVTGAAGVGTAGGLPGGAQTALYYPSNLFADLSQATAATINQIRLAFQVQRQLERDARGGTRYTEIVRSHFGVISPDARLQRPEYLGGGVTPINISPVAQTSGSGATGTTAPLANLGAIGTMVSGNNGFSQSFTEHGYIIGLVHIGADLTYQQGLRRHWSRNTRNDFYFPVFAHLGEQAVLNKELYFTGVPATDDAIFGYQERWSEYRHNPSEITGLFRSTAAGTLDIWHLSQRFIAQPLLNASFIEDNPPISRVLAVASPGRQFIFDCFFDITAVRPLPMYSVPGMLDHF